MKNTVTIAIVLLFCNFLTAQNFRAEMKRANPVPPETNKTIEQIIATHQRFLEQAIKDKNDQLHFFGLLFLIDDYEKKQDFVNMTKYIQTAEKFSQQFPNPRWNAAVTTRKAYLKAQTGDDPAALSFFKQALEDCKKAKDLICMGETYEQIATKYVAAGDFATAEHYYKLAAPLLKKDPSQSGLAAFYHNYSIMFIENKRYEKALAYLDSAVVINRKRNDLQGEISSLGNKIEIYINLHQYDKADLVFKYCESISLKNKWYNNLANSYYEASAMRAYQGKYKESMIFLQKYYHLNDSIKGSAVQTKISSLEENYKAEAQTAILNKKRLELESSQRKTENYAWFSFSTLSVLLLGGWFWRKQTLRNKKKRLKTKRRLPTSPTS
ncbi:tetratricopeptide repeat protein [Flavobacterium sp. 3HN19-14]|uniref:tetratricopeptide repeat protein n=1 Tax=Flavobacterium sp. 3HN19-14 TaxID=3448133 RepID=UPI003EE31F70